jgi:hypothetical protein
VKSYKRNIFALQHTYKLKTITIMCVEFRAGCCYSWCNECIGGHVKVIKCPLFEWHKQGGGEGVTVSDELIKGDIPCLKCWKIYKAVGEAAAKRRAAREQAQTEQEARKQAAKDQAAREEAAREREKVDSRSRRKKR